MKASENVGTSHFAILDGLRGLAALCVVLFHLTVKPTRLVPVPSLHGILGHAYMAVDFFFLLSGFVIAHAYEKRLATGFRFTDFCRARLIRLYPLFVVGLLIGALSAWLQRDGGSVSALLFIRQAFFIPLYQHGQFAFPYNLPAWSLMFELLVNLLYAAFLPWLGSRTLVVIISGSALLLAAMGWGHSGINFGGGHPGMPLGLPRTALSFSMGILLFRAFHQRRIPKFAMSAAVVFAALGVLLAIPAGEGHIGDIYDMFCVLIGFPAIIVCCLHISSTNKVMRIGGDVSYPLYVIHFPLLTIVTSRLNVSPATDAAWLWLFVVVLVVFVVATSWILLKIYDEPLRRKLRPSIRTVASTVP
jgi:peptidoglycan/LPS O-acetylase OafA/YrhL